MIINSREYNFNVVNNIVRSSFSSVLLPGHQEVRAPAPAELFAMFTLFGASAPHIVRPFDLDNGSSFHSSINVILHVASK